MPDSDFCLFHDPARAAQRAAARRAGGLARHGRTIGPAQPGQPVTLATIADVARLLEAEVNSVLTLEKSLSRGHVIARLATAFIQVYQVGELEQRIAALEERLSSG